MPNYVKNRIKVKGDQKEIDAMYAQYSTQEEGDMLFPDCNKVYPMPFSVRNGYQSKQEWRRNTWGTWGLFSYEKIGHNTWTFTTAWSSVPKIITKMSREFPSLEIEYSYADEDYGCNLGKGIFKGGNLVSQEDIKPKSKEAYELVFEVWDNKDDFQLVDDKYIYNPEGL
jgi:hypothetical protein